MRAIYLPNISFHIDEEVEVIGNSHHHLKNVLRIPESSNILILDGNGSKITATITKSEKRKTTLKVNTIFKEDNSATLDIFVSQVKKDAMDLVFKQACELKIRTLYIGETEYSQRYEINQTRLESVLQNSIEQSNNSYFPVIKKSNLEIIKNYEQILYFDSVNSQENTIIQSEKSTILILGPEGGFSDKELNYMANMEESKGIHFDTAILRTPTAFACAVGYVMGALSQK